MLKGKIVSANEISEQEKREMFSIMQKYYENIQWYNFVSDLAEKKDVVLLWDEKGGIHGFTSLGIYEQNGARLLFSGDTIVEREYWGRNDLSKVWVKNAVRYGGYWLLLTKGYKTYKFLHTFFKEFYPRYDKETPENIKEIMDEFGKNHYGEKYQNGIYRAGKDYLREEIATVGEDQRKNPNTAFFLEKNPGYTLGDELLCLAELSADNLNKLGRKMLGV